MTFLLYIGKNKDFLRKFSKLENVQMIYAQNYQDVNPEKPDVPLNKNDAFQKVQKRRVQEKR